MANKGRYDQTMITEENMIIHNSLKLLQSISEIETLIHQFEREAKEVCPSLNTRKFLEIVLSQVLEKRIIADGKE